MPSHPPDHVEVLLLAVACFVPALPAAWKIASLRGDTFSKWSERVDLAHAGLNERATSELLELQAHISDAFGGSDGFTPAEVWLDPAPFIQKANRCAGLLRSRSKLRRRFHLLRQIGPALIPVLVAYVVGLCVATLYYTDVVHRSWEKQLGLGLGALAVVIGLGIFVMYAYLEAKLAAAEEMAAGEGS